MWGHWQFINEAQHLHHAGRVLGGLCDLRLPTTLTDSNCLAIAEVLRAAMASTLASGIDRLN